ncbi:hypothetical protein [Bradyrhizobium glycinis]|uniref:hypothetical protein n=1 Tax=Bradyrhizobium glycinis TaxID=2751812 RepID=UPI0018D9D89C|nr:hypothetical protein [Bradyrhizobium glycinis]MBH5371555.1 hypothetical protein [Bradyrhizobium glycinis]
MDQLPAISKFLDGWQTVLSMAGVGSGGSFNFDEIWEADEAQVAVEVLVNPKPVMRLENFDGDGRPGPIEALLFRSCSFGHASLTYCAKIGFEYTNDPIWRYRSKSYEPLDVRAKVEDLEEYGFEQGEGSGVALLLHPQSLKMDRQSSSD